MEKYLPKEKQDDIAFFSLAVASTTWILLKSVVMVVIITTLFIIGYLCFINRDKILVILKKNKRFKRFFKEEEKAKETVVKVEKAKDDYSKKIILGKTDSKKVVALRLEEIGHMFVAGMTRYGKTKFLHALISELVKFPEEEVQIAFSDAKGVSFNIFSKSKHLFAPIAMSKEETETLIVIAMNEMYRRLELFKDWANDDLCTNLDEYYELSGERLPRIVFIFDELADSVEPDSDAERNLTTIAKMGLAAGIHLVLSTQRPTKQGISHEIQTQCQTVLSTYMKTKTEYGQIAKVPQVVYQDMRPVKGLFMIFSPELAPFFLKESERYEGWGFIRSEYLDNNAMKIVARKDRGLNRELPSLEPEPLPKWEGTEEDKINAMKVLEERLNRDLTTEDMVKFFGVTRRTAEKWLEKL